MLVDSTSMDREDGWNSVVGSAVAGSLFTVWPHVRNMTKHHTMLSSKQLVGVGGTATRAAFLYGSFMVMLHPELWKQGIDALGLTVPDNNEHNNNISRGPQPWYDRIDMLL